MIMQPPKKKRRSSNVVTPCWYYDKKELHNTPSIQDGIDYDTECRYRKEGARFIIDTGTKMDLGYNTMATGVVYFHRFYMFHSFRNFPRYVTACCCLFLAGKVEETPKKCKDIIKTARTLLTDQKFLTFGDDPKEEVMTLERILLQTIKFDLQVEHPYSYLLKYAKCLKGDKSKLQKMVQMAWTFVNDSLCTTLCLQWEPEIIAVALMYLAGKLSKFEVVDWAGRTTKHTRWWDMFIEDVTMELLEDICHQVLDLYSAQPQMTAGDSPPQQPPPHQPSTIAAVPTTLPVVAQLPVAAQLAVAAQLSANTPIPGAPQPPAAPHELAAVLSPHVMTGGRHRTAASGLTLDRRVLSPASPVGPPVSGIPPKVLNSIPETRVTPNGNNETIIPGLGGPLQPDESSVQSYPQYPPPATAVLPPQYTATTIAPPAAAAFPPTYTTPAPPSAAAAYTNASNSGQPLSSSNVYHSTNSAAAASYPPSAPDWRPTSGYV
ncbi:cyclin-K [Schistocerca cancellata]|uniref:cyclin-K n=1 Tax=Schistocerca cancellata TaxID=274614 RepID=UPI0021187360|nr:cyclin-K [Schistocerca cancellata]